MSTNKIGLDIKSYGGSPSTLCTGCGHDSISNHISQACFQSDIHPSQVAKMSGIGCSSKIPAYFMSGSFSFNSMHGRMAPLATGAKVAQPNLYYLGISGDGDSANIGIGGFIHLMRRNLPICYISANNGVFGLTKGQFSATADLNAKNKSGSINPFQSVDLCSLALESGCTFVARSFSGDGKQLVPLIKAALKHKGTAFIDVISPCITFNNHDGSTKSYTYVKEHDVVLQELGFIAPQEEILVDYNEGETTSVTLVDGSRLTLKKLDSKAHDVQSKNQASELLRSSRESGKILTGLFYVDETQDTLVDKLNMSSTPLAQLQEKDLRPQANDLQKILKTFK
jgi:2-oxoglutarate ferredoxin oxidoreductase subunit beta